MAGQLGALLLQVRDRQAQFLAHKPINAVGRFKKAMKDQASVERSPLVAEIASDKQAMAAAQSVFDQAKLGAAPLASVYAGTFLRPGIC